MKPNQTRPGKKTKPSQALDDAVERLIDNDVTTNILITLLEQHVEQGGKVFQKKSAKNAMQGSVDFRQFVNEQDVIDFNEEGVEERSTIQDKLADLNADMMFELYLRLGREHAKRERAAKKADEGRGRGAQQAGQTSAADQVEDEDDDEPVVPSRKRRRTSQGL